MPGAEQNPSRLSRIVDKVKRRETLSPEDQTWNAFMEKPRNWRELAALIQDEEIQSVYQERAMEVLLCPDTRALPFPTNLDTKAQTYVTTGVSREWMPGTSEDQALFIAQKLPEYIQQVEEKIKANPDDRYTAEGLFTYNELIHQLLKRLPQEQAEKLFEQFKINDPVAFVVRLGASGYTPLKRLFTDDKLEESWKRKAAEQMHTVIEQEVNGMAEPREDHEQAAKNYGEALKDVCFYEEMPVSKEFFQDEVSFLLKIVPNRKIMDTWYTGEALDQLEDPTIRHTFVRTQVLGTAPNKYDKFWVHDKEHADLAQKILSEFPDDVELKAYLEPQLKEWVVKFARMQQEKEQEEQRERSILAKMKKPQMNQ